MNHCPLCYGKAEDNNCDTCNLKMTEIEMLRLKASTYDSIISHLNRSCVDARRREQARTKIALRNIKKWAIGNLELIKSEGN